MYTEQRRLGLHPQGRQSGGKVGTSTAIMEPSGECWALWCARSYRREGKMAKHGFAAKARGLARMPTLALGSVWNVRLSCKGRSPVFHLPPRCGWYFTDTLAFQPSLTCQPDSADRLSTGEVLWSRGRSLWSPKLSKFQFQLCMLWGKLFKISVLCFLICKDKGLGIVSPL